ncbi:MAG TPA: hypothetical protein VNY29_12110 [Terriglobales bacterium]|jgi:hypothetical protein|nr:hypothetical protein [Terriglobales bacterium]
MTAKKDSRWWLHELQSLIQLDTKHYPEERWLERCVEEARYMYRKTFKAEVDGAGNGKQ